MSGSLTDLLATDAQLDRIGAREAHTANDHVLDTLAMLAGAVDEPGLPPLAATTTRQPPARMTHKGSWALSLTVALMITSSGVAAAVSDDPLAPLHYVTNHIWDVGRLDDGQLPGWELGGSLPLSTLPDGLVQVRIIDEWSPSGTTTSRGDRVRQDLARRLGQAGARTGSAGPAAVGSVDGTGRGVGSGTGGGGGFARAVRPDRDRGHAHGQGSPPGTGHGAPPGSTGGARGPDPVSSSQPVDPSLPDQPTRPGHASHNDSHVGETSHALMPAPPPTASPVPPTTPAPASPAPPAAPAPAPPAPAATPEPAPAAVAPSSPPPGSSIP